MASYVTWNLGTHEPTFFIMHTHCEAVSDSAMRKNIRLLFTFLNKRLYEYYPQRLVRSADFLANPSDQTCFFNEPLLYVYYLLLVISLLFKVYIDVDHRTAHTHTHFDVTHRAGHC